MKKIINIVLSILILGGGYLGWQKVVNTPKKEEKEELTPEERKKAARARIQQTRVATLTPSDFPVVLETQGTVRPSLATSLTSRVAGRVTEEIPAAFNTGSFFSKGQPLLYLDTTDFKSEIVSAEANYARAFSALQQEKARGAQALRNWKDIGFDEEPNELVLRVPQRQEAEANLAAQAENLARARRNLEYATIRAPFDGRVRSREVGPGQSVGTGTTLGEIFSTDTAEVRLPLSARQLTQIDIDETALTEIDITLSNALQPDNPTRWNATIVRVEGELDETSRELFVIATIEDPFGLKNNQPPLRINQPVKAHIVGNTLQNVVSVPREALNGSNEVILVDDEQKINRQKINVVWSTQDAVISDTPELHNSTLALSRLSYAPTGSPVRILKDAPPETSNAPAAKNKETAKSQS